MDKTPLRVEPGQLRDLAERMDRNANALNGFRLPDANSCGLPGSAVAAALHSARATERLTAVAAAVAHWADSARASAAAFENTEQENARRLGES